MIKDLYWTKAIFLTKILLETRDATYLYLSIYRRKLSVKNETF